MEMKPNSGYKIASIIFLIIGALFLVPFIQTFVLLNINQDSDIVSGISQGGALLAAGQSIIFFGISLILYEVYKSKSKS